jgi:hypothetical protein
MHLLWLIVLARLETLLFIVPSTVSVFWSEVVRPRHAYRNMNGCVIITYHFFRERVSSNLIIDEQQTAPIAMPGFQPYPHLPERR